MAVYDPLIHPALLDPRQWADVNLYQLTPPIEREPVQGSEHHTPDRRFAMKHLRLDLTFDIERESISGSATLEMAALADGFETIELDAAEMNISSVTRDGTQLEFETEKERLTIDLDRPFARGEDLIVRAELPGIKPQDVNVEIDETGLTIRGESRFEGKKEEEICKREQTRKVSMS